MEKNIFSGTVANLLHDCLALHSCRNDQVFVLHIIYPVREVFSSSAGLALFIIDKKRPAA